MSNKFLSEREGQIKFFADLKISADVKLTHNTDGVYRGTLFEFKLTISDINKVLFQAIKYLSHRRIKGENVPAQILLVALNEEIAYLFNSEDFLVDIEKIYAGSASKNNTDFNTKIKPEKVNYSILKGLNRLTEILDVENYTKIHIDVFDVVGWANRFYQENPTASKIKLFKELRTPKHFASFIYPWTGDEKDFKYIMDLLNDKQHKKELGAFYTPPVYCLKATELVRKAIKAIPKGHDYIILDRCAGTGSLEEFLTDKQVDDITIGELNHYIDKSLKAKYLQDKADIITTFYSKSNFNEITVGELEKHNTKLSLHDYIFDNELSHTIVNTYELKEWIVLNERIGDRVKLIIPPPQEVNNKDALVDGGDALSSQFVTGQTSLGMTKEYNESISMLLGIVKDKKTNIILYENPPYRDSSAANVENSTNRTSKGSLVFEEMKKDLKNLANSNVSTARDISNQFIWSGWNFYMKKSDDHFVLFSPIKYWKSLGLGEREFIDGFLFNRQHFHAGPSVISCILWQNQVNSREELTLKAFDIDNKKTPEQEDDELLILDKIKIKKAHRTLEPYFDKRSFPNDRETKVYFENDGKEITGRKTDGKSYVNENIVGYLVAKGYAVTQHDVYLLRGTRYNIRGFYLRSDNFIEKLPLFAAKLYPQKNWYERDVYFTTADGGDRYLRDKDFLKTCFIFACLSQRNHCRSFDGSDDRFYKNELCFDKGTLASNKVKNYKLTKDEQDLLDTFNDMLIKTKQTKNYNKEYTYGMYQIDEELNTRFKNENDEWIYDYPELNTAINSLKTKLAKYYEAVIQPKLFEYELLK
ncbi:hypothetical protein COX24_03560 [bacterium (Candidatus Gribaldobacteria) CG23_combo_of_CG06-09_8_20_14_all_37_87_8]|uniref:Uncharacterized protein n=1 Tax=bacterium (Candidatus Gribaldobacteria) CG23_combo_of_CG06-09_8_20_14_all_37_87_8 TaxID=2014278 RepID=A0A2G9ZE50_9BACT|nr:MAG: hypothetical protein COX24_03560 [bacterium (Candidatus Gribaldobacteria) CG23_combo_of_CG06-09_8_20_14_all_37_87_8]